MKVNMAKNRNSKVKSKQFKPSTSTKSDKYEKKFKRDAVIKYLRVELGSVSTHGLPYIVSSDVHWIERSFWVVNFIIANISIVVLLSPLYVRLITSPTVMSVDKDYLNWNVSYPAITLCPKNKIDEDSLTDIIELYKMNTGLNLTSYIRQISSVALNNLEIIDLQHVKNLKDIRPEDYASIAAVVFKVFTNVSLTTNNNVPIGVESTMTEMGMCHAINSNVATFDDPLKWRENIETAYERNNIEISVYDAEFFSQITNYEKTYTVYVHSPDEVLQDMTATYNHDGTGFLSIGVNVWITRIADQLRQTSIAIRKCRLLQEPVSQRYPIYTFNHCMLECRIRTIQRLCGCLPHFYKPLENERICNLAELKCLVHYKREILTLSPNPGMVKTSQIAGVKPSQACGCLSDCERDVFQKDYDNTIPHSTLNRLRVGLASFPKVRVVRDIIFGLDDILLRSGGVINLCVGSSIISMMEIIVVEIKLVYYLLRGYVWSKLKMV